MRPGTPRWHGRPTSGSAACSTGLRRRSSPWPSGRPRSSWTTSSGGWRRSRLAQDLGQAAVAHGAAGEHRREALLLERLRKMEALAGAHTHADERPCLLGVLDPLGDDVQVQALSELHDAADEVHARGGGPRVLDERPVDLEHVDREALEVAERRVAGAEVVHRQPDAERAQPLKARPRPLALVGEDALGDLEDEAVGGDAGHRERVPDLLDDLRIVELA